MNDHFETVTIYVSGKVSVTQNQIAPLALWVRPEWEIKVTINADSVMLGLLAADPTKVRNIIVVSHDDDENIRTLYVPDATIDYSDNGKKVTIITRSHIYIALGEHKQDYFDVMVELRAKQNKIKNLEEEIAAQEENRKKFNEKANIDSAHIVKLLKKNRKLKAKLKGCSCD